MIVKELRLKNFRCFTDAAIPFDERLTVLVGKNGSGKSAILDAVASFLSKIVAVYIDERHDKLFSLNKAVDKTISSTEEMNLVFELFSNNNNITLREPEKEENIAVIWGNDGTVSNINRYAVAIYDEKVLTAISYYTTSRLSLPADEVAHDTERQGCKAAYHSCFTPGLSWGATMDWIDRHDAQEARQFRSGNKDFCDPQLNAIREAVKKALPGFDSLSFNSLNNEITVRRKTDNQTLSFQQLSDGYRAMLSLILDLARRMALANGEKFTQEGRSILESPAIVLIDEIELHLHPGWQQTVLPSLLSIFPNTQFIVSTHSPQVLSSIPSKNIRILDEGKIYAAPYGTEGAESSRILKRIFNIELRPPQNEYTRALYEYQSLVYSDQWDCQRARELREILDKKYQGEEPLLTEIDLYIDNRKWELDHENN